MKRLVFLYFYFFISSIAFAQKPEDFKKLIKQTNTYFSIYDTLYPRGEEYYAFNKLGLTKEEIKQAIKENDYDMVLSMHKDSIESFAAIDIIQVRIERNIKKITEHPDFNKNDIVALFANSGLYIVKSPDNKLYNFSFDAKNGGTYHMRVSIIYYTGFDPKKNDSTNSPYSIFSNDGYGSIDTISTTEGTKYVLTGSVQGCSQCFGSYVTLIKVEENTFVEEFHYAIDLRDYETGVSYDCKTKTIFVSYQTDDLTSYCSCESPADRQDEYNYSSDSEDSSNEESSESDEAPSTKFCECKFVFNGRNFKLVKESWEILDTELQKK